MPRNFKLIRRESEQPAARRRHLAQFLGVTAGIQEFEGDEGNAAQTSSVACVVNQYGPSDFTKSYGKSVDAAEVLPLFLGGNLETHASPYPRQPSLLGHPKCRANVCCSTAQRINTSPLSKPSGCVIAYRVWR